MANIEVHGMTQGVINGVRYDGPEKACSVNGQLMAQSDCSTCTPSPTN